MEIRYPLLFITITIIIFLYIFKYKKEDNKKKKEGTIANTKYLKATFYYKQILKKYNLYKKIMIAAFIVATVSSIILVSRIQRVETHYTSEYKRDIILCMDVSTSVDSLNISLTEKLKDTVKRLDGERFGISIFNTTSILLTPLTDDYEYVVDTLDELKKSLKAPGRYYYNDIKDEDLYITYYSQAGTLYNNDVLGSSLISNGLASCIYSFPKTNEDRTRIIVFSTDNEDQGKENEIITLKEAAELAKKNNITIYGIGAKTIYGDNETEMKEAVELTGGKYFEESKMTTNKIVEEIGKSTKTLVDSGTEVKRTDLPTIPFITLILSITVILFCRKKVIA